MLGRPLEELEGVGQWIDAKYSVDGRWYKAEVVQISPTQTELELRYELNRPGVENPKGWISLEGNYAAVLGG